MQLLQILEGLTPNELNRLEKQLKDNSRKEPYLLLRELRKYIAGKKLYNREDVFASVYQKALTAKNNYLLYNDIRYLKKVLTRFLVEAEFAHEINQDEALFEEYYLKALHSRNINGVFDSEVADILEKTPQYPNPKFMATVYGLKHFRHNPYSFKDALSFDETMSLLNKQMQAEIMKARYAIKSIETEMAFSIRANEVKKDFFGSLDVELKLEETDTIDLSDPTDLRSLYLILLRDSHLLTGEASTKKMEEAMQVLRTIDDKTWPRYQEESVLLNNLAIANLKTGNPLTSRAYFDERFEFIEKHNLTLSGISYNSYLRTFTQAGQHQEAIEYFMDNKDLMLSAPNAISNVWELAVNYLILGESKEAMIWSNELSNLKGIRGNEFQRRITIMAFINDHNFEQAKREIQNYKRAPYYVSNIPIQQNAIELIDLICKAMLDFPDSKRDKLLAVEQIRQKNSPGVEASTTDFVWIRKWLQRELG